MIAPVIDLSVSPCDDIGRRRVSMRANGYPVVRDFLSTDSASARERLVKRAAREFHLDEQAAGELEQEIIAAADAQDANGSGRGAGKPILTCMADVEPQRVRWLWPHRIALGKLTLIAGDPGLGKSTMTADFCSRVTNGLPWPDGTVAVDDFGAAEGPGGVVVLTAEDGAADTFVPRLNAAGADRSRVFTLDGVAVGDDEVEFDLRAHLAALVEAIESVENCRMVIIDPISAHLGATDSHNDADVRAVLKPVAALAERLNVAIVGVAHLNKGKGAAIYRTMGSLAFVAAARAAWGVVRDKADPASRLFVPIKNNLGPDQGGLRFSVVEQGGAAALAWDKQRVNLSADEAMEPDDDRGGERRKAKEWLRAVLADGPVPVKEVQTVAKDDGHAWATVRRAQSELGVIDFREGFGKGSKSMWQLPPAGEAGAPEVSSTP